ncbi:hypothetical protein NYE67_02680 [Solibacillus sp. FSL W8-0474]|uniref:hypothetical protein n=1 Tax=Solibacillus sp. FSL W8-0474 TaxID=2975336 RepID=UPI0030F56DF9
MSSSPGSSSSPRNLYFANEVLKNYEKEDQLRNASKKQLDIIKETLHLEIQHQNGANSLFLTFLSIFFALFAIMISVFDNNQNWLLVFILLIYIFLMTSYYFWSSLKLRKLNELYNLARFVHSTK